MYIHLNKLIDQVGDIIQSVIMEHQTSAVTDPTTAAAIKPLEALLLRLCVMMDEFSKNPKFGDYNKSELANNHMVEQLLKNIKDDNMLDHGWSRQEIAQIEAECREDIQQLLAQYPNEEVADQVDTEITEAHEIAKVTEAVQRFTIANNEARQALDELCFDKRLELNALNSLQAPAGSKNPLLRSISSIASTASSSTDFKKTISKGASDVGYTSTREQNEGIKNEIKDLSTKSQCMEKTIGAQLIERFEGFSNAESRAELTRVAGLRGRK